jgi:hypothetical protein
VKLDLYEEEIAVLSILLGIELEEVKIADIHGYTFEYQLFLSHLREKLLENLMENPDNGRRTD